ncbi:LCP family protein [Niallia sp. Krafla_26]|uniref:LCP family protein n=1 Tax=Niallia sp. Krafla_26 TaxID=3064703 RepID=UPI003D17BCF3
MVVNGRSVKIQRKKKKRNKILKWYLIPIVVIFLSALTYGTFLFNKAQTAMDTSYEKIERDSKRDIAVNPEVDNISILFIGVDDSDERSYGSSARSDALILATFNKDLKSVNLLSIPRDSYVKIPDHGKDKITHAHAFGGATATIETVENLFEIPVDYYVKMNFNAFVEVVDALGGIEVEVPYEFGELNSEADKIIYLTPGLQKLNGEEALALSRTRKLDSDIERGKRQMDILKSIISKASSVGSVTKYGNIIDAVGGNMTTDLSFNELTSFIDYIAAGSSLNIETLTLQGGDLYIPNKYGKNIYYYGLDEEHLESVQNLLKSHLELKNALVTEDEYDADRYYDTETHNKYSSVK